MAVVSFFSQTKIYIERRKRKKKVIKNTTKMVLEEVPMQPLSKEKQQQIITVEQNLKYHTFKLKTKGIINQATIETLKM